ncbi:MAG: flagellar protein export ATPase FliI [Eubacteriales bacterium]|jgi:flagellum-specific ATP synthase|nr:flagellar protein export ATPase FliI [Eubacteriales bacterium]MDD3289452.1 flagellar protein export ATPase FliI [Eubacteriales bacterium]MDD3863244.1 flagellar protein export ATPase FliI [Eubacteriales bacterium]MDD4444358.1 flagellar protein export ATPase FliI [Eubacteriales bacterium]
MESAKYRKVINEAKSYRCFGKIDKVIGMMIESTGPECKIGDLCKIYIGKQKKFISAEVVGFRRSKVLLMPFEESEGISAGDLVETTGASLTVGVSEALVGRVINAIGQPLDGKGPIENCTQWEVRSLASNPLSRPRIQEVLKFGIKAIDGLLTIGKGQRMGIFSGSGVGKSTLMGMIARNIKADINVIALVGERGREVREFLERDLGEEGLARSVLIVSTSDQPSMQRMKCAMVATTIAEYFKDQGKDVLLMMDSLTRFAMAQREIGLATGEPPVARGYTPSIYSMLPKLLERTGNFERGSITGIYTVLVEGDDVNEPISDTVRGIIDGHIVLSRKIAMRNHYPAIDVLGSVSRLMNDIVDKEQLEAAGQIRNLMSVYDANYDLVNIGAYKSGTNPALDRAIDKIDGIHRFLQQEVDEKVEFQQCVDQMKGVVS